MDVSRKIILSLKISSELNEKLMREAEKERRSRHSQIIYTLEKSYAGIETGKEKRK